MKELIKIIIIGLLIIICIIISYYCYFVLDTEQIFTHFFYIPIVFSAFWWGYKSLFVAAILSVMIIITNILSPFEGLLWISFLRIFMFFLTGTLASFLEQKSRILIVKLNFYNLLLNKQIGKQKKTEEILNKRTNELEEKNKELEEFNELFIGREFRIKELRDRVKELEGKL